MEEKESRSVIDFGRVRESKKLRRQSAPRDYFYYFSDHFETLHNYIIM